MATTGNEVKQFAPAVGAISKFIYHSAYPRARARALHAQTLLALSRASSRGCSWHEEEGRLEGGEKVKCRIDSCQCYALQLED